MSENPIDITNEIRRTFAEGGGQIKLPPGEFTANWVALAAEGVVPPAFVDILRQSAQARQRG